MPTMTCPAASPTTRPEHRTPRHVLRRVRGSVSRRRTATCPAGGGARTQVPLRCLPGAWIHSTGRSPLHLGAGKSSQTARAPGRNEGLCVDDA